MSRRSLILTAVLACGAFLSCHGWLDPRPATALGAADKEPPPRDVFGPTRVWAMHLEITAGEYAAMQPPPGGFGFPGGPAPPPKAPKDKRASEKNLFGTEFPWAEVELTADGKT